MRSLVSGSRMKEIDRRTIEDYGIPSIVLMERAALAAADEAERMLAAKAPGHGKSGSRRESAGFRSCCLRLRQ